MYENKKQISCTTCLFFLPIEQKYPTFFFLLSSSSLKQEAVEKKINGTYPIAIQHDAAVTSSIPFYEIHK